MRRRRRRRCREKLNAATLRQDQRYLPRSMRRLTGLISVAAMLAAVVVFLSFRAERARGCSGRCSSSCGAAVGFSDHFGYQDVARITQSNEVVARVKVWHNDKPVQSGTLIFARSGPRSIRRSLVVTFG